MHIFPLRSGLRPALVTAALAASAALAPASNESLRQVPPIAELWEEPRELERRDLFLGPSSDQVPPPVAGAELQFVAEDSSGASPGFEVADSSGRHWDVKLGVEAQSEVAASRVLWAVGFHQRPTYYLSKWVLTGRVHGPQPEARFRPKLPGERVIGDWSWRDNPFVGTREYGGLIVVNLILNNWDWKTSNNKIYEITNAGGTTRRMYVVRDLGASLGRTAQPALLSALGIRNAQGTKNDLAGFEAQDFVQLESDGRLDFDYHGLYDDVVARASRADIRWACDLLSRLSDRQLADAFRAGGYSPGQTARYVLKLKQKIAQGLAASVEGPGSGLALARSQTRPRLCNQEKEGACMSLKDKLEIGLKPDAPYRKENLPEGQQDDEACEDAARKGDSPSAEAAREECDETPIRRPRKSVDEITDRRR